MSIVPAGKKIPAGILGILFGSLGIHKFFMGFPRAGLTMLGLTLLGAVLGCAFPVFHILGAAMGMIGFAEGIIYLVRNDSDFYNTYIIRRQEWF